jgi:hypothetical protein
MGEGGMTELNAADAHEVGMAWPLSRLVKVQLAFVSVWAPHFAAFWTVMALAMFRFVRGAEPHEMLHSLLPYWLALAGGMIVTAWAMPKAWPAAGRVGTLRRLSACTLGAGALQLASVVARHRGVVPGDEPFHLAELSVATAGSLAGAWLAWQALRESE